MRKLILYTVLLVVAFTSSVHAQVDRSKAPAPAPARQIKLGEYQTFTLKNGLQVFVVENRKLPRIQFSLELKNDPILEGEKAGYVSVAGSMLGTGTSTRSKAQLDEEVDFIGANLNIGSSGMFASSLSKHTTKLLELASDALLNPVFQQEELDKIKKQNISGLAAGKDNPNTIAANVRRTLLYSKNHPYGEMMTEKSVESITLDDCKNYYNTYFKPNNAYLIVVGDIDFKSAKSMVEKYFGKWTKGEVKSVTYPMPKAPEKTMVALVDRPNAVQSVISISYPLDFHPANPDAIKARVLNEILGGGFSARLMQNLREDKGYTYGASSSLSSNKLVGSFNAGASVRNEVTDSAVYEFLYELKKIVNEPVTDAELAAAKASIAGSFGRSLESPQTVASFALNTAKYNLPKDYYANYVKNVEAVTKEDIMQVAKKFIRPENAYILVVGKGADVAEKLKRFGEVKYFDVEGNSYVPSNPGLPAGLTAEKVLVNYINAIGGLEKVNAVTTTKAVMKGNVMGTDLTMTVTKKAALKSVIELNGNGMTMQKMVSDGKDLSLTYMGQKPPIDSKLRELQMFDGALFKELAYTELGAKAKLTGIQNVDGKEAYAVEFTLPQGEKTTELYDKETGLKIQTLQTVKGPQGDITVTVKFADYKEVSGVKFPHTMTQSQGPMNIKFEATSYEVNPKIEDTLFTVEK